MGVGAESTPTFEGEALHLIVLSKSSISHYHVSWKDTFVLVIPLICV